MEAWLFSAENLRFGLQHVKVQQGLRLEHVGPLMVCRSGFHASVNALDALSYAPGSIISRVQLGGHILEQSDKLVASIREHLWVADATEVLRQFMRDCALDVIHLWDPPQVVRDYLKTGNKNLRVAARDAAAAAAAAAAWDAAREKQIERLESLLQTLAA